MTASPSPVKTLSNGVAMPAVGLGTWPMDDAAAENTVHLALDLGYRLIDTAENYNNETGVGRGIRNAGIDREALFLTTKFNRKWHSIDGVRQACEASLRRLGVDYIDLFLIHWPNPDQGRFVEAFEGLLKLLDAGKVRAIGTSNFKPAHLQALFARGFVPHLNQIQLDPYHLRDDLTRIHADRGIVTGAWSPIGRGGDLLGDPAIREMALRHGRTPAQIVLRWHVQHGVIPTPKSANPERLAQNLDLFDFSLSATELQTLDRLDRPDPGMLDADNFGH